MKLRVFAILLICAAAEAASSTASVTINATETISSGTNFSLAGTATLTIGSTASSGTFTAPIPSSALQGSGNSTINFTMTFTAGTVAGTLTIPAALLSDTSVNGSGTLTISSATGSFSGDSGSIPLTETESIGLNGISFTMTGSGTLTTGGAASLPPPSITAVLDAGSYTPNIAQGSIFVVKGTNLSASGYVALSYPLQPSSGGTSITFTPVGGGAGTQAFLIYLYNQSGVNQLAAVLPSTLATGSYNVTVTYNSQTSQPFSVVVVQSKPGIFTQDTTGSGLALAQNFVSATEYDLNRLTTATVNGVVISPAKPGQTVIIYLTGLGPVPGGDNIAESSYNFLTNGVSITVLVGGTSITPAYAGRVQGFSGLDQINVTLPANIATGCTVVLQVVEGKTTSAATTLSIAPSASAANCVLQGFTNTQLSFLDNGGTYQSGGFALTQSTISIPGTGAFTDASVSGGFTELTGLELPSVATGGSASSTSTTIGNCTVTQITLTGANTTPLPSAGGVSINLDAGAVKMSGPTVSGLNNTVLTDTNGVYSYTIGETGLSLPGAPTGTLGAGPYSLTAAGGTGVTAFNSSITLGAPLVITGGLPATVVRSSGLPLSWTGGNASDPVTVTGYSGTVSGTGASQVTTATEFVCTTTAGTGGINISSQVLNLLPATAASTAGGAGYLSVSSGPAPATFSTTLTATPSTTVPGTLSASVGTAATVTYQ